MKSPFFKSLVVAAALVFAWNCSDESVTTPTLPSAEQFAAVTTPSWILNGDQTYIITPTEAGFLVADKAGNPIGTYDPQTGVVADAVGTPIASVPDLSQLPVLTPDQTIINPDGTITDLSGNPITPTVEPDPGSQGGEEPNPGSEDPNPGSQGGEDPNPGSQEPVVSSSETPVNPASSATINPEQPKSSSSVQQEQPKSSAAPTNTNCDGQCLDAPSGKCVAYYASLKGPHEEQYAYDKSCTLNCYYDPNGKECKNMGAGTAQPTSSNTQQQPKSSSSSTQQQQPKSSSSVKSSSSAKSSSSQQQQQQGNVQLPKVVSGAQTKSGYATRYWDSCKPHCAWEGKGGPVARTCKADGTTTAGSGASSVCDGGNAGTCFDQTPQIVNDTIAYAFAATPGGGNDCGKCYMLTFKGTGASATSTPTDEHHRKIKGKHLIVMSNNIGYDVSHNQFDLMIPGGGPGAFNGCQKMGISCAGAQYGGFLTTCNYKKDCLINMCNQEYANNTSLKNGCLFLANWMDAANNPEVDFVEVECPQALKDKY